MVYELTANVLSCYVGDIRLTSSRCVESSRDCTTDAERIIHTVDTSDLKVSRVTEVTVVFEAQCALERQSISHVSFKLTVDSIAVLITRSAVRESTEAVRA